MGMSTQATARILIEALRFSVILQLLLGFASGIQISSSGGVGLTLEGGRKFLHDGTRGSIPVGGQRGHNNGWEFLFMSKIFLVTVPGMVIFSCAFPCFRRKKIDQTSILGEKGTNSSSSTYGLTYANSPASYRPKSPYPPTLGPQFSPKLEEIGLVHLSFNQVAKATQNFSPSLCIGEGGIGKVYKGQLPDGQKVAIKRAKKEYFYSTEFKSEIEILSKIGHRNLVRLLGYVDEGDERLIITEYVSNGTLRQHLDGERGKALDFSQRLEISIDVAHGLTYLHMYAVEKQIIHRDVKSSNILITEGTRAKVADFGLARGGPQDTDSTHITTQVKGTLGYLDPEYMRTNHLTPKSDVYSFGILLLEILTGRRPVDPKRPLEERVLIQWVFKNCKDGNIVGLVDPQMEESVNVHILKKMFRLAFHCAGPVRADRPDMKDVGEMLWTIRMEYKSYKE